MAIKRDIPEGTIISKRVIKGHCLDYTRLDYTKNIYSFGFLVDMEEDMSHFNVRPNTVTIQYLRLMTRRARSRGAIVTDDMVPLLQAMDIKLIPISNRHIPSMIKYEFGFYSPVYTYEKSASFYMSLSDAGREFYDKRGIQQVHADILMTVPLDDPVKTNYYIAVGTEVSEICYSDDEVPNGPNIEVSDVISKYEGKLVNHNYKSILDTTPYDILRQTK